MSRALPVLVVVVVVPWAAAGACAAPRVGSGGAASSSEAASTAASAGGGFTTSSAGGGGAGIGGAGVGGGCSGTSTKATPIPLDILVMLDQSGSMSDDAGNGMTKWETVKGALTGFMQQPTAAGIGMGIQYFGVGQPLVPGCYALQCTTDADCVGGCGMCLAQGICQAPFNPDVDSCDAADYAWADVPVAPLPGVESAILTSLGMHAPGTNTPTAPALQGAVDYAAAWATGHPGHVTVVAFATDGEPSECDTSLADIDAIAAAGLAGTPSVRTFVIGVGGALSNLDGIAAAGGTQSAYHVDLNPSATSDFLGAMNAIRGAALGCTYQIPAPPPGMTADYARVNVVYKPGGGGPEQTFPNVADEAHCPPGGDGWHYDDDAAPTEIILCSATCAKIDADQAAEIDVVLGCSTIVK